MNAFVRPRPLVQPTLRMIVFHHAGGSAAMYYPMLRELPADWDLLILDLPGRGKRRNEEPISGMPALVARVVEDVRPWLDAPIVLFGHSLGAILASEVGRILESLGAMVVWVGVSGRAAPDIKTEIRRLCEMEDQVLLNELMSLGGVPDRITEMPEFCEHFLKVVRSDLAAADSYEPAPDRAALTCPVMAFSGTTDPLASPESMLSWANETRSSFQQSLFPGGHFYFLGAAFPEFMQELVAEVLGASAPLRESSSDRTRRIDLGADK